MNWQIFKLGIWICMLSIGIPVSYKTEGEWFSSTESMDLLSFIDEMCISSYEVELSLLPHTYNPRPYKAKYHLPLAKGKTVRFRRPIPFKVSG